MPLSRWDCWHSCSRSPSPPPSPPPCSSSRGTPPPATPHPLPPDERPALIRGRTLIGYFQVADGVRTSLSLAGHQRVVNNPGPAIHLRRRSRRRQQNAHRRRGSRRDSILSSQQLISSRQATTIPAGSSSKRVAELHLKKATGEPL